MPPRWNDASLKQSRITAFLHKLGFAPPKSLLLEGGTADDRLELGLYWAARLNCMAENAPCGVCRVCMQIQDDVFRDLILLNGAEGTIPVDTIREVRSVLSDPPTGSGTRVVILAEAQVLEASASNALLKSLEEPRPGNMFVLLAPNRETLLPTLVSRSFVLTLGWPVAESDPELADWLQCLAQFVESGRGSWLEWTGKKGNVDNAVAGRILREVQRALLQASYGNPLTELARILANRLDLVAVRQAGVIVENALESLDVNANPAITLEWAAIRIWGLLHR